MRRFWFLFCLPFFLSLLSAGQGSDSNSLNGFESLFNNQDLTGWKFRGESLNWGFDEGVLYTTGEETNFLISEKEFSDFELRLDYMVQEKGISGLALRAPMVGDPEYQGIEIQIQDDAAFKKLRPTDFSGSIYDVVPANKRAGSEAGHWNHLRIIAKGRRILVELNKSIVVDADLDEFRNKSTKHPGLLRAKGHIALRSQKGRVEFCNLFIKPL
jgi:hypothetical protein